MFSFVYDGFCLTEDLNFYVRNQLIFFLDSIVCLKRLSYLKILSTFSFIPIFFMGCVTFFSFEMLSVTV